ncbi:glycosyltransferase family 1 protein [Rhodobacterales bacterium]|nr:glycosyltransferase family 1 protein [Rhodobacterales bacterium]
MIGSRQKIMIATLGTRGDVQPYVALASELVRHDADVVIATGEGFRGMIEKAGASARPLPIDYEALLRDSDLRKALFSVRGIVASARKSIDLQRNVAETLWQIGLDERPDLILFNLKATVMTLVARRLNVPCLPTELQPVSEPTRAFAPALFDLPDLGGFLNRKSYFLTRKLMEAGLGAIHKPVKAKARAEKDMPGSLLDGHMPYGARAPCLHAYSRALVPRPEDWPEDEEICGYWFTEPVRDYQPDTALGAFLETGPPPVYLGFGSMPSRDPKALTRLLLDALSLTGQRAVVSSGWGGLSNESAAPETEARVFHLAKAPHSWLFPRCSAVVHHGGAGTTHEALRWGKPSLVCPVFADQHFWGARVHAIGAGPAPLKQKTLTVERLATALGALEDGSFQQAAERTATIMAGEPAAAGTAERVMALLESRLSA